MTESLVLFRSKTTGKTGYYPAHFEKDWPDFVLVDPDTATCEDCTVETPPETPVTIKTPMKK